MQSNLFQPVGTLFVPTLGDLKLDAMLFAFDLVLVIWVMAFGACIGSLTNVLVYRLPRGLDVVTPTSACPSCGTHLTWRENIPIFGWLMLGGKCRFCMCKISAEYPIVEAFMALLWAAVYILLYARTDFLGINWSSIRPDWANAGFALTWPMFLLILILFSCLVSMTLIDARTFHIPMVLTWVPAIAAFIIHPLFALWTQTAGNTNRLFFMDSPWHWTIASPGPSGWGWIGLAVGGMVGVGVANLLLATKLITRSFADYDQWMASHQAAQAGSAQPAIEAPASDQPQAPQGGPEMWVQYPHARREMFRELIFLGPIIGLGLMGWAVGVWFAGPWTFNMAIGEDVPSRLAPLWLLALAGASLGFLIAGGAVWAMRLFGSLAFGKEAMGLGDVHMMAAVGACLGWIDGVFGFFGAAFVGLGWWVLGWLFAGMKSKQMPFGPYLAIATVLVWFLKPWLERGLGLIMPDGVVLP
jgi:leader peptidase (prepilin peptidase) / N-methyltransferase